MTDIIYLDHSGFAVAVGRELLIFDYCNDSAEVRDMAHGVITKDELARYDRTSVFASHGHGDHFIREIFAWAGEKVDYYLSSDIQGDYPGVKLSPGDTVRREDDFCVHAFGSTDLGISALVDVGGIRVFHAGDLNWWHWREESTPREIEQSEVAFKREMEPIIAEAKKAAFDIAFFPVDPRQRTFYDAGANYFILSVKPRVFIPMHTMGRGEVAIDFARRTQQRGTKVVALTQRGQAYRYEL